MNKKLIIFFYLSLTYISKNICAPEHPPAFNILCPQVTIENFNVSIAANSNQKENVCKIIVSHPEQKILTSSDMYNIEYTAGWANLSCTLNDYSDSLNNNKTTMDFIKTHVNIKLNGYYLTSININKIKELNLPQKESELIKIELYWQTKEGSFENIFECVNRNRDKGLLDKTAHQFKGNNRSLYLPLSHNNVYIQLLPSDNIKIITKPFEQPAKSIEEMFWQPDNPMEQVFWQRTWNIIKETAIHKKIHKPATIILPPKEHLTLDNQEQPQLTLTKELNSSKDHTEKSTTDDSCKHLPENTNYPNALINPTNRKEKDQKPQRETQEPHNNEQQKNIAMNHVIQGHYAPYESSPVNTDLSTVLTKLRNWKNEDQKYQAARQQLSDSKQENIPDYMQTKGNYATYQRVDENADNDERIAHLTHWVKKNKALQENSWFKQFSKIMLPVAALIGFILFINKDYIEHNISSLFVNPI